MKIHIYYKLTDSPNGGGNQFLKALRNQFRKRDIYAEHIEDADIILFNGHQHAQEVAFLKKTYGNTKKFVHRLDGVQKLYNKPDDIRQDIAIQLNRAVADASVYQSEWSAAKLEEYGLKRDIPYKIIRNAPDDTLFTQKRNKELGNKIKVVTTCWSPNMNKGFDVYKFIDENLDFDKYEYHYIGNLPPGFGFKNIITHPPMETRQIAALLPHFDVFLSASKYECLSNSIIEALYCGVPCLVLNSGANPETIRHGGAYFDGKCNVLTQLQHISENINFYSIRIECETISEITDQYINFFKHI